ELGRAYQYLLPLAIESRTEDREVMEALGKVSDKLGLGPRAQGEIDAMLRRRDQFEAAAIRSLGGTGVRFRGVDRFKLGGVVVPATAKGRARAAVILVAPGDTLPLYDSLCVHLRRAGFASILLDVRGSVWSVDEP